MLAAILSFTSSRDENGVAKKILYMSQQPIYMFTRISGRMGVSCTFGGYITTYTEVLDLKITQSGT